MGGTSFITGTVFLPSGAPINVRMVIRLISPTAGDFIASTDNRGQFIFSGLREGNYSVVIEGERDYEPVNQLVEVLSSRSGKDQPYNVSIRLVDKAKQNAKPTVIQAENAEVPKRAMEYYSKALELSAKKDHKAAIEQLKLAVAEDPKFMNGYNEMGVQYMRLNELEQADEALMAALKIKADAFEPMLNRGIVLFRLKRLADAQDILRRAIAIKDQSAMAHFYLGRTFFAQQQYDEAERELNLSITIGGDEMKEAHRILAMLFIYKDDRPRAIAALEKYLLLMPNAPDVVQLKKALAQLRAATPPGSKPLL